jgi:hypothetical protein
MGLVSKAYCAYYPVDKMQSGVSEGATGCDNLAAWAYEMLTGYSTKTIAELPTHKNNETSLT